MIGIGEWKGLLEEFCTMEEVCARWVEMVQLSCLHQFDPGQWPNYDNIETFALLGFRFAIITFRRPFSASLFLIHYSKTSQSAD